MSRLSDLIKAAAQYDQQLAKDLRDEIGPLQERLPFGLNFERHQPEAVELPRIMARRGHKVRVLRPRGEAGKHDKTLWIVTSVVDQGGVRTATLTQPRASEPQTMTAPVEDLIVVAEFRDPVYPGLHRTGGVTTDESKPVHTVINGENFHALQLLTFTHRGKVDAIYLDPPYNTGASDWRYNNSYVDSNDIYRHSKWLAFMERRLVVAKELLKSAGVLIVTIDEHELHRLGLLLDQTLPGFSQQVVTIVNNPKGVTQGNLSRVEEYAIFCFGPDARPYSGNDDLLTHRDVEEDEEGVQRPRWKGLLRSGDEAARADRPNLFYPVWIDPATGRLLEAGEMLPLDQDPDFDARTPEGYAAAWPVRRDGSLGRWGIGPTTLNELIQNGYAAAGGFERRRKTWGISYLSAQVRADLESGLLEVRSRSEVTGVADVAYVDEASRRVRTVWHRSAHDAGAHGADLLAKFLPDRKFPFPKSLYAVEDALRVAVGDKPNAIVVDAFAGSGTTAHATMRLNHADGGNRQSILITNNEVSSGQIAELTAARLRPGDEEWEAFGICDFITKPRVLAAIQGKTPDGADVVGRYRFNEDFPMSDGMAENAEFFTLQYLDAAQVREDFAFASVAPMLWLRAGARGRRIERLDQGWDMTDTYGIIRDLDESGAFITAALAKKVPLVIIITNDDHRYQMLCAELPYATEKVRMYEAYLTNFELRGA